MSGARAPIVWQLINSTGVGGAERSVERLAAALRRRGVDALIVLYSDTGRNPWVEQLRAVGESPIVLDGRFASLKRAMAAARPTIVHCHGYKAGILGRLAARLVGSASATTFHSGDKFPWPVSLYETVDLYTSILGARIAVSEGVARRIPYSSIIAPNFTPTPDAPDARPLPKRIGFVGRLSPEKGPDLFCEMARRFKAEAPDIEWVAYGDGPMRAELEGAFADCVSFEGVAVDMSAVWRRLGLLAMPSRFEGLPFAALEASAAGVPIVASHVGAVPRVVVDGVTGWLHDREDLDAALGGVRVWAALTSESAVAMRAAAWRHIRTNFPESDSIERIFTAYVSASKDFRVDINQNCIILET